MDDKVKQVILEVIDSALNEFDFINKEQFYTILLRDYGLSSGDVPENYGTFHKLLAELYGIRHFKVEREIVRILHDGSMRKEYREMHEIPAFEIIVESYFEETRQGLAQSKTLLNKNKERLCDFDERESGNND